MTLSAKLLKRVQRSAFGGQPQIKYRIQFVDKTLVDEATTFFEKEFLPDENIYVALGIPSDREAVVEVKERWRGWLHEGISLAANLEDEKGNQGPMIGCYMLSLQDVLPANSRSEKVRIQDQTELDLVSKVDIRKLFNCASYIRMIGLAVASDFRKQGVGKELSDLQGEVCRQINIPVVTAMVTTIATQKLAEKAGYQTLSELDLAKYQIDGKFVYPNTKWPWWRYMAKRYF